MTRRDWLGLFSGAAFGGMAASHAAAADKTTTPKIEPLVLTDAQWRERLTPAQYHVLREEGTERAFTSPLNDEKHKGTFRCAGCDLALFTSDMKFDSGTGWPSFFTTLPGAVGTKRDFKYGWTRVEYHCARCGGHHGHVFDDGPKPTGMRYCNNGVALKFVPEAA
jgi:peptide-methionine (R)-S-oxide reductase